MRRSNYILTKWLGFSGSSVWNTLLKKKELQPWTYQFEGPSSGMVSETNVCWSEEYIIAFIRL